MEDGGKVKEAGDKESDWGWGWNPAGGKNAGSSTGLRTVRLGTNQRILLKCL